jgi:hypothetical protein
MTFLWLVASASLVASAVAWRQARRNAKRLEEISQMYWELRYQHGELRSRLQRLTDGTGDAAIPSIGGPPAAHPERPAEVFVPLTSLRR